MTQKYTDFLKARLEDAKKRRDAMKNQHGGDYWEGVFDGFEGALEFDGIFNPPATAATTLWQSTSDFFLRFLNRYPPIMDQLRVMHEEELEVTQAALTQPENLPVEVADLIVTAMGLMMSLGFTMDDLNDAMLKAAAKNDAKTLESHEVNSAGKIAKIKK